MIVTRDLYDIASRIREIDPDYFVVYDRKKGKYELHTNAQRPTYVLTFPYQKLDARCVEHTLKTRVANLDRVVLEMDRDNARLERDALSDGIREMGNMLDKAASKAI